MDVLQNQRFERLEKTINRKSFCDNWSIAFAGHFRNHNFSFSEIGTDVERRLHVELSTVDRWFRVIQYVQPPVGSQSVVSTMTCGVGGVKNPESKISKIALMSVDDDGFFRPHTRISSGIRVPSLPETQRFESKVLEFDPELRYAFVIEFTSSVDIELWNVSLEFITAGTSLISGGGSAGQISEVAGVDALRPKNLTRIVNTQKFPRSNTDSSSYKCFIDRATERRIEGWAVCSLDPSAVIELDVFLDGIFYSTVVTDMRRDDLARRGLTTGRGGFRLELPKLFRRDETHRLAIRLPDGTFTLEKKLEIENDRVSGFQGASWSREQMNDVAIVVPVYNAYDDLKECIDRLNAYTDTSSRFILVDDASTDERVWKLLQKKSQECKNIEIEKNKSNLGFSATVNLGIRLAGSSDVVLLNSDARVTPGWLEGLRDTAHSRPRVATVTPFSDNAGAFSAPDIGTSNKFLDCLDESEVALAVKRNSDYLRPEIPTGNGFCMYVRRAAIDEVGHFDSVAFPKGYGEENDFCLRCRRAKWVNLLDDSVYVFHERSASFGDSKKELMLSGRQVVDERYPEFSKLTPVFQSSSLKLARYRVRQAVADLEHTKRILPRALFVYSTQSGGTPQTNRDLMSELQDQFETWTLRCDSKVMYLEVFNGVCSKSIEVHALAEAISGVEHRSTEYDEVIRYWLVRYDFKIVHIRHLAWHSLSLPEIVSEKNIPVVMSFHDFYSLCPTVNLLDDNQSYCGGKCSANPGQCSYPLWPSNSLPILKNAWVHRWREMFRECLLHCNAFVTTSESVRATMIEHLPEIGRRIEVIPHGRDLPMAGSAFSPPSEFRPIRILVPGNIGITKGLGVIHKLLAIDYEQRLEFHIIGSVENSAVRPGIVYHGMYERGELSDKVNQIAPTVAAIFSIVNETWSHTLTEMWAAGVPTMVFDIGTVAARVRESQAGWVFDNNNVESLYNNIIDSIMDVEGYSHRRESVIRWQRTTGIALNCANMASRYFSIYRRLLSNKSESGDSDEFVHTYAKFGIKPLLSDRVAVVCPADACLSRAPASTHIRVWSRTRSTIDSKFNYFRCTPEQLLAGVRTGEIRNALIQRNVLPVSLVKDVVRAIDEKRLNVVFDVDDQLLSVPESKDPYGRYKRGAPFLKMLISSSNLVTVSTEALKSDLLRVAKNVEVVPNYLDDKCWKYIDVDRFERMSNKVTMLYMGSRTHDEDLDMFLPAFDHACGKFPNLYLKIIGGYSKLPKNISGRVSVIDVPEVSRSYPEFVNFLESVTSDVDFGVCPLIDTSFNKYKSGLKHLEYCGLALSGLYSKTRVYEELVDLSGCGVLVENTLSDWSQAIVSAASHVEEVRMTGVRAHEWVMQNRLVSDSLGSFENLISQAFRKSSKQKNIDNIRMAS